jgi:hypothetical protein
VLVLVSLLARAGSRPKIARRAYGETQAARNCRSLLNLQRNDSSVIGSRLVFHFGGGHSDVALGPLPDSCIAIRLFSEASALRARRRCSQHRGAPEERYHPRRSTPLGARCRIGVG